MSWLTDVWDGIKKFASNLWTIIKNAAADVWAAISKFFTDAWAEIKRTFDHVWTFVQDYWWVIVTIIVIIIAWYYSPYIAAANSAMASGEVGGVAAVELYATAVYLTLADFAAAIHLEVLLALHQIAFVISPAYRELVSHVYGAISQVSLAMGWGAGTMYLLLANSRTLVIDASTALGKSYDIAEITWFSRLSDFMKVMQNKMNEYKADPGNFLQDMAVYLEKPDQDAKSMAMFNIYSALVDTAKVIKLSAETVTTLKNDVDRLVAGLPNFLQQNITPYLTPISKKIDDFVKLTYDPAIKAFDSALSAFGNSLEVQKEKAAALTERLARPGKYLQEIYAEDEVLQQEDLDMVADVSERSEIGEANDLSKSMEPVYTDIKEGIDEWEKPAPPAFSKPPRFLTLEREPERPIEKILTPFVGDY